VFDPYIEGWELRELVRKREIRPREVAEVYLSRIERLNSRLGAFYTIIADRALADAERLEKMKPAERANLPLFGIAYSLKDLTWTKDIRTTLGSKSFENWYAPADAELTVRLKNAGGILLGKTTTPEFGMRPTTEGGLHPPARNPWNLAHTAGGSSGGAAVAVASGLNPIAQGSDGGGSIRIPAACCGLVGLKTSRARITAAPEKAEGWGGLATTGPITRTVRDAALMLDAMAGGGLGDPYTAPAPQRPFMDSVMARPHKLRLGAIRQTALSPIDPEMLAAFDSACVAFRELGHEVEAIDIDPGALLREFPPIVVCACVGAIEIQNPDLLDTMVRPSWEWGRRISAAEYLNALTALHNTSREIIRALAPYDGLLTPTLTRPAPKLGTVAADPKKVADDIYSWISFTFPFNSTGQPAISLPNGFNKSGLPLALQIVGRPNDEAGVIALAAQFEEARPWKHHRPPVG
jgi:Asp-tRNA(Asn)/Glu-tRNA(Gln) amidotransferase A subunit family amidase